MSVVIAVILFLLVGYVGYNTFKFASSDVKFAESLRQAQANNGQRTYELQTQSINEFPYRSDYHRIFSQINLALANSIAAGVPQGQQPPQQVQQNILTLLQQSINSGRNAVTLAPLSSLNWQNLGTIYRSLINVGQNADQFSVASMGQAIALDPYNPQLRVALGGVYYQLQQWDLAQQQFQLAIDLKRDFANAYYNLGHTLESKGDLQNALAYYQTVRQLSADNPENLKQIESEISALEAKIGEQSAAANVTPETDQTPLAIPSPAANLPEQRPPVRISPPPPGAGTPAPTAAPTQTPEQ
jgi:tetratricopeptide (TPR) repeat protein